MRFIFCLMLLVFVCSGSSKAQDSLVAPISPVKYDNEEFIKQVEFDKEKIDNYKNEKAFDYLNQGAKDSWWTRFKKWVQLRYNEFTHWLFGDYKANTILAFFLQILPYLIIAGFFAFACWLFIRLSPGTTFLKQPAAPEIFYSEEERLVHSEDLSSLINTAIGQGDYRLAIRYYYLRLLKRLNHKGVINYQFQKTNAEYLEELKYEQIKVPLKKIIRLYDFIWYGNFPVSGEDFTRAQQSFKTIETILNEKQL